MSEDLFITNLQANKVVVADNVYGGIHADELTLIQPYPALEDHLRTFPAEAAAAVGFVGRTDVFAALEGFREQHASGYFRIVADAGLGKTVLAAEIARRYRASVFFA